MILKDAANVHNDVCVRVNGCFFILIKKDV